MNDDFNKKLDDAFKSGDFDPKSHQCNNPEEEALLSAGKKIYQINNEQIPSSDIFKNQLLTNLKEKRRSGLEKEQMKKESWTKKWSIALQNLLVKRKWIAPIAGLMLIVLVASLFYWLPLTNKGGNLVIPSAYAEENFKLEATRIDQAGVEANSDFILSSKNEIKLANIKANLSVNPDVKLALTQKDSQNILIHPQGNLEANKIYQFKLKTLVDSGEGLENKDFKWAYQTKDDFKIMSSIPGDKSQDVPLNTGIEINFSHPDFDNWEDKIIFEPKIEGGWEKHNKVLVFVPKENLQPTTLYKVVVSKDMQITGSDKKLGQDYSFAFITGGGDNNSNNQNYYFHFYKDLWSLSTTETQAISVAYDSYGEEEKPNDLPVKVFQFDDKDKFFSSYQEKNKFPGWAYWANARNVVDTADLKEVMNFKSQIQDSSNQYNGQKYFAMPTNLNVGYYLVQVDLPGKSYQTFLQITNLACYTAVSVSKTMMWCFDLDNKQPAEGAVVKNLENSQTYTIQNDGTTLFDTPATLTEEVAYDKNHPKNNTRSDGQYFEVSYKDKLLLIETASTRQNFFGYSYEGLNQEEFWSYTYKDRTTYQSNDTVKIWGYIKGRDNSISPQGQLEIVLKSRGWSYTDEENEYIRQNIDLKKDNTFQTELALKQMKPGYYTIEISDQNGIIARNDVEIKNYSLSPYRITLEPEKKAVQGGDTARIKVKTQYFDGTPAPFVDLEREYYRTADNGIFPFQTDKNGEYVLEIPTDYQDCNQQSEEIYSQCIYRDIDVSVFPKGLNEAENFVSTGIIVFDSLLDIKMDSKHSSSDKPTFDIEIKKINLEKLNRGEFDDSNDLGDVPAAGISMKLKLTEEYWEKTPTGEIYGFIQKKKIPTYKYDRKTNLIKELEVKADDNGKYSYEIPNYDNEKSYYLTVLANDEQGRTAANYGYYFGKYFDWSISDDLLLSFDKEKYKLNEQVRAELNNEDKSDLPVGNDNKYLFYVAQRGIRQHAVLDEPKYSFNYTEKELPVVYLAGVQFTGYGFRENLRIGKGTGAVIFDSQEKGLKFDLKADKEKYLPGDEVNLTINVKDKDNQSTSTSGVLSVVDEAYLYKFENVADPLADLYDRAIVSSGIVETFTSHEQLVGLSKRFGGGFGANGGGGMRSNFKDTAYFQSWTTDRNGKAQIKFQLPDNITSWRASALAINDNINAGVGAINLTATLPIMVNTNLAKTYLSADRPIIQIRADGTGLKQAEEVNFEIEIPAWQVKETLQGKAFEDVDWKMPELKVGDEKMIVRVKAGDLEDAREYSFKVIDSYWKNKTTETIDLAENIDTKNLPADSRTQLKFFNQPIALAYGLSQQLAWQDGERLDQKLARKISQNKLSDLFQENIWGEDNADFLPYSRDDNGLSLLPYSSSDLQVSALAAGAGNELLNNTDLKKYFEDKLSSKDSNLSELVWAVYGLANLDQPVLNYTNSLNKEKELTVTDRLVLALAMNRMGAQELAKNILKDVLKNNSDKSGPYIYINDEKDPKNNVELTALAAALAFGTDQNQAIDLWGYCEHQTDNDNHLFFEKALIAKNILDKEKGYTSSFNYSLNGASKKIELKNNESFSLDLTKDEIGQLKFSNISGKVKVVLSYDKSALAANEQNPDLNIRREYLVDGKVVDKFEANNLVEVRLYPQIGDKLPEGMYQIRDILPSGLKVATEKYQPRSSDFYNDCSIYYPYDYDGQAVNLLIGKDFKGTNCGKDYISYFARTSNLGEFTSQPVSLFLMDDPATRAVKVDGRMVEIKYAKAQ